METGERGDEYLGRLSENAEGDAALRQLRRRYEHLRRDYEHLLDRLGEIEDRLIEVPEPHTVSGRARAATPASLESAIVDPLVRLREEYAGAAARIHGIISGLERMAAGAMKGQHGPRSDSAAEERAEEATQSVPDDAVPEETSAEPEETRPRKVSVEVHGRGFGELLDFQEKLSSVPGVSRVSINAIDAERATLIVELGGSQAQGD